MNYENSRKMKGIYNKKEVLRRSFCFIFDIKYINYMLYILVLKY